jgi:hypothetical protein
LRLSRDMRVFEWREYSGRLRSRLAAASGWDLFAGFAKTVVNWGLSL